MRVMSGRIHRDGGPMLGVTYHLVTEDDRTLCGRKINTGLLPWTEASPEATWDELVAGKWVSRFSGTVIDACMRCTHKAGMSHWLDPK